MCEECKKQIAALIAENERLSTACTRAEQVINAESKAAAIATGRANLLQAERDQLKAENEALRKDDLRAGLMALAAYIGPICTAAVVAAMGKGEQS